MSFIEEKVRSLYYDVSHIGPGQLDRLKARDLGAVVLYDVRAVEEQTISRIPGSTPITPSISTEQALEQLGDVRGKTVVFYCAIGLRSSKLAARLQQALREKGAVAVHNLSGGMFRWHNEGRPLVNELGRTEFVHPYKRFWTRFLARPELARNLPSRAH